MGNETKITISLKKDEREALKRQADKRGIPLCTLCAELVRKHIRKRYTITKTSTRQKR